METPYDPNGNLKPMEELDSKRYRWPDSPTSLNYSFLTTLPSYYATLFGTIGQNDRYSDLAPLSGPQQISVGQIFSYISTIIPIEFHDTTGTSLGDITFAIGEEGPESGGGAVGYYPDLDNLASGIAGDIWIWDNETVATLNNDSFKNVILHEIGHALGLEHTHAETTSPEDGPIFTGIEDTRQFSIMSYNGHVNGYNLAPFTFGLYDIAALQAMYGKSSAGAFDDNTYGANGNTLAWGNTFGPYACIWDAGGTGDTLSAEGMFAPALIDLREGRFSSIVYALTQQFAGVSWEDKKSADNISIAFGSEIEIGIGTAYNDLIIGNPLDNILDGGAGNDKLFGSGNINDVGYGYVAWRNEVAADYKYGVDDSGKAGGDDLIFGGLGDDLVWGGDGDDILLGDEGADILIADDDEGGDVLFGGEGADEFWVSDGDAVIDFGAGDKIYLNGVLLTGGEVYFQSPDYDYPSLGLPFVGEQGISYGLFYGGMAVMTPNMSAPVIVFGGNFDQDFESEVRHISSEELGSHESINLANEDGSLKFTLWQQIDHHISTFDPIPDAPSYANESYAWQKAGGAPGTFYGENEITGWSLVDDAGAKLSSYGYGAGGWNDEYLLAVWGKSDGANGNDGGQHQDADGSNQGDQNGAPTDVADYVQQAAAAIANAGTLITPLVLDLDGDGIELTSLANSSAFFDLDANSFAQRTGWVTGGDGLLAIDVNKNGQIDDINELFGAPEPYGKATTNGFDALAALDSNTDGKIDSSDAKFGDLKVWIDADEDGITDSGELKTLSGVGIESISLNATENVTQSEGNTISHIASYTKTGGGTGTVADVWFANSSLETYDIRSTTVDATIMALPALRGYGEVAGLRLAMTRDPFLFEQVRDLSFWGGAHDEPIPADLLARIENVALLWMIGDAGITDRGENIDSTHLIAMERFTGQSFFQSTGLEGPNPGPNAAAALDAAWGDLVLAVGARILVQGLLKPAFAGVTFDWGTDSFEGALDVTDAVTALAALAPAGTGSDAYAFWKLAVATLDAVADDLGIAQGGYDTDLADVLSNAGFELTLAQLRDANVHQVFVGGPVVVAEENVIVFGSADADDIRAAAGDDTLLGGAGNDHVNGQGGSDTYVFGKDGGHDVVSDVDADPLATDTFLLSAGIAPADVLIAREGDDLVIRIAGTDSKTVIDGQFFDSDHGIEQIKFANGTVWNRAFIDALPILGAGGDDTLAGTDNNDFIDGAAGADEMTGGKGSDTYSVDAEGDVVTEAANEGTDLVLSSISYILDANVEQLVLTTGDIGGTGNALDNVLIGTDGANVLDGGEGADLLVGNAGEDTFIVDNLGDKVVGWGAVQSSVSWSLANGGGNKLVLTGDDDTSGSGSANDEEILGNNGKNTVSGGGGDDSLDGAEGDDTLDGGEGNDTLTGGLGADKMTGGASNDIYWVDDAGDQVLEAVKKGIDAVYASIDFTLSANVENLTLVDGAIIGTGNAQNNKIVGSDADNVLDGAAGNDEIEGGLGNDSVYGGDGNDELHGDGDDDLLDGGVGNDSLHGEDGADLVQGGQGNDALNGGNGNDVLAGDDGDDNVIGGSGNDQLDGGIGADALSGGSGNDTYIVDDAGDVVSESSGQGTTDLVQSTISYVLTANVERLTLTGTSDVDGTGNSLANLISGNDGANILDGGTGNDTVDGGTGNDLVTGGDGNDTLSGQAGIDTLQGGNGNDILVWDADDFLDGGANRDTLLHTAGGAIDVDTAKLSNIEVVNLGAGDDNDNGIILGVQDVLDLAASSSGSGFSKNGDVIDLLIYGDNATATRDNVELGGTWTAAGTFSTSALTGSTITFNIYQASGTQVAVQQGLDLTIA